MDPYLYSLSPLSLCSFFTVAFLLLVSSWGLALNPRARTNQSFFVMCLPVIVWVLGLGFILSSREPGMAERWYRFAYLGVVLISPGVYFFTSTVTRQFYRNRIGILLAYVLALLFGLEGALGHATVQGVWSYDFGFYPRYGPMGRLFLVFFFLFMAASFRNLFRRMRAVESGVERRQIRAMIVGFTIAYLGAWDFIPCFGVPVYPVGFIAFVLYASLLFGSVYRDQLLNPSPESLAREVLATIADSIIVLDADGYVRMVNPKAEELLGHPGEGLLHKHFSKFMDPGDVEAARGLVRNLRTPHRAVESGVFLLRDKDGNRIPTSCNLSAIRDWKGKAAGFVLACRDLKEIVRSREIIREKEGEIRDARERYSALFNRSLFCVYLHDFEGNFLDANQSALDLLGYTREEIRSLDFACLLSREDLASAFAYLEETVRMGRREELLRFRLRRKDGSFVWVETESSVIYRSGEPCAIQGIARDITERKQAEEDLKRHNEELMELDRMKDSFLSSVSHELRTPLTSIRSFSEILLRYDQEDLTTQREFLRIINTESERLTRLINDVLDLSRIEAGGMVWNDDLLEFDAVIHSILPAHQRALDGKSLRLSLDLPSGLPPVLADPDRMRQVVTNLLINAVKFSHEGGEIHIAVEAMENSGAEGSCPWIKVSVADEGIGIDEDDFEAIFDKFRQVTSDAVKSKPEGTGLGLHICKDIIHHYGGRIWVESEKGRGSTFRFILPAASPGPSPGAQAQAAVDQGGPDRSLQTKGPSLP